MFIIRHGCASIKVNTVSWKCWVLRHTLILVLESQVKGWGPKTVLISLWNPEIQVSNDIHHQQRKQQKQFNLQAQNIVQFRGDFLLNLYSALAASEICGQIRALCRMEEPALSRKSSVVFIPTMLKTSGLLGGTLWINRLILVFPANLREGKERIIQNEEIIYTSYWRDGPALIFES